MLALAGVNPYWKELDKLQREYEEAVAKVKKLEDTYTMISDGFEKNAHKYQALVENLRTRITEKDEMITLMDKEYNRRIEELTKAK